MADQAAVQEQLILFGGESSDLAEFSCAVMPRAWLSMDAPDAAEGD